MEDGEEKRGERRGEENTSTHLKWQDFHKPECRRKGCFHMINESKIQQKVKWQKEDKDLVSKSVPKHL